MGYVILFSAAYPMAAVWAFLNNLVEIRGDAFKLVSYKSDKFDIIAKIFNLLNLLLIRIVTAHGEKPNCPR